MLLLLYLLVIPPGMVGGQDSWCSGRGNFSPLSAFYEWRRRPTYLSFKEALTSLRSDIALIEVAKLGLANGMAVWENKPALQTTEGKTHLTWSGRYIKLKHKPAKAELECNKKHGRLPRVTSDRDDTNLAALATRYGLTTLLVAPRFEENGLYTRDNYFVGAYSASGAVTTFKKEAKDFGALVFQIVDANTTSLATPVVETAQVEQDYLCEIESAMPQRSKTAAKAVKALCNDILDELLKYGDSISKIVSMVTGVKGGAAASTVELPAAPTDAKVVHISRLPTGIDICRFALERLSAPDFYIDSRVDIIVQLTTFKHILSTTRKEMHFQSRNSREPFINIPTNKNVMSQITKRSLFPTSPAIYAAQFILGKIFKEGVAMGIVRYASKAAPTILYLIRPFVSNTAQRLVDKYLVSRGAGSFTTLRKPSPRACQEFPTGEQVCDPLLSVANRNFGCAKDLMAQKSGRTDCKVTDMEDEVLVYTDVKCAGKNQSQNPSTSNDLIVAAQNGSLNINCFGGIQSVVDYAKGTTIIPRGVYTGTGQFCSITDQQGKVLSVKAGTLDTPFKVGSTLVEGPATTETTDYVETPFGRFTKGQLVLLLILLTLTLAFTAVLSCLCFCSCFRKRVIENFLCCCYKGGWRQFRQRVLGQCIPICVASNSDDGGIEAQERGPEEVPMLERRQSSRRTPAASGSREGAKSDPIPPFNRAMR